MAARSVIAPRKLLPSLVVGLFEEARRLGRRRRYRYLLLALVVCAAAAVAMFDRGGGGTVLRRAGSSAVPRVLLVSRGLPALGDAPLVSVAGGRLIVSDGENTGFADGRVTGICPAARINAVTLRIIAVVRGNCGDPTVFGERVIPVEYAPVPQHHPRWGTGALVMRIATVDRAAADGYRLGPVIVSYPDCSDCRAETIYGDGSLWVYASMTTPRSTSGVLLRVSEATGRVVERWRMPWITRALLATDADGLWIAPSIQSGFPGDATASQKLADTSLYRIAPGLRAPQRVIDVGLDGAGWLAAASHTVWLDAGSVTGRGSRVLWRLTGPNATVTLRAAPTPVGTRMCGDLGDGPVTVLGSATGVYCVNTASYSQSVSWLGRTGRRGAIVARVRTPILWNFADNAVTYDGSYYFIDPPATFFAGGSPYATQGTWAAKIYRVTPGG